MSCIWELNFNFESNLIPPGRLLNVLYTFNLRPVSRGIVCKLSSHELRLLGVADSSDIMSLCVYCSKYGRYTPPKLPSQSETPKFNKPNHMLENLLEEAFKIKQISVMICVTERIIYRQMNGYSSSKISFTNDSDAAYANESFECVWPCRISLLLKELVKSKHCMKSIRIWSYSGRYFPVFRLTLFTLWKG